MNDPRHPYLGKPDFQFWKRAPGHDDPAALDPVVRTSFRIRTRDRVVTAGSCFAQHVARHLVMAGLNHHVTEPGHPMLPAGIRAEFNYGVFSARYGNLYTARQLHQLLARAYGQFEPAADFWDRADGRVADPFRPQIQPKGFVSRTEAGLDRTQHLAAVRRAIEEMDVFVFTLGLTEAWVDQHDGTVFPLAPGVAAGRYDPRIHHFRNFGCAEVIEDLNRSIEFIRARNPRVRILLTVSPVPLNATALERHVLVSTTYSKSVLRVAAEEICATWPEVEYFPSYEIITAPQVRGRYYAADARAVLEEGVRHVMGVFFRHYTSVAPAEGAPPPSVLPPVDRHLAEMEQVIQTLCDEEAISGGDERKRGA
jgi:GSCFA family